MLRVSFLVFAPRSSWVVTLLIALLAALDFDGAFTVFHSIFFPGKDNWLFDPVTDPVILILPEAFFRNCAIAIVSILCSSVVFSYVNWQNIWVRIGMHLLLLIPVVGITYEFNRLVGRHDNALTRVLSAPGMWLQNFTVNEPDDSMLEVAIEALKLVLPEEKGKDRW